MDPVLLASPAAEHATFAWPLPHALQLATEPAGGHSRSCVVEGVDGRSIAGDLLSFVPDSGSIALRLPGKAGARRISIEQIRLIRLRDPFTPAVDTGSDRGGRAGDQPPPDKMAFVASLNDGTELSGLTRGFVRNRSGLYLFLLQGESPQAVGCFVPAQQLRTLQMGTRHDGVPEGDGKGGARPLSAVLAPAATDLPPARAIVSAAELVQVLHDKRHTPTMKLGEFLLAESLISAAQLEQALAMQRRDRERRLGDILVDMGLTTVRAVQKALIDKLGVPFVNVRDFSIEPATLRLIPPTIAMRQQVLPLLRIANTLVVAVENPLSNDPAQGVQFVTGMSIACAIAAPEDLRRRIALEYADPDTHHDDIPPGPSTYMDDKSGRGIAPEAWNADALANQLAREAPAAPREIESAFQADNALVRLVNKIIIDAHAQGASDIHIESNPGQAVTRIRLRKDGELEDYLELQPEYRNALISRIKIMAGLDISEHRHSQDGKINFARFGPLPIELRVVVIPISDNREDVVMRLLGGVEPLPLESLGFSDLDLAEIKHMVTRSYGLILICGPTGSGKTTTLHSVLHHINRADLKIWTAEDPVEITQSGLRQVQINARIGWTFAAAMRAFLRADPDVIMVGEMRDAETTKIGIEASLTGHLVFSTLHTNSAAESVVRLLDLGMDPFNFADALIGILSQRLARKLCPHCRTPHTASEPELADLAREYCVGTVQDSGEVLRRWQQEYASPKGVLLYEATGCERCSKGYRGRLGIYELLTASPRLKGLIGGHGTVPQLVEAAREGGMKLLKQDAIEKALRGFLDLASARAAAS